MHEFLHVLSDPGHLLAEVVITLVFDAIAVLFSVLGLKRWLSAKLQREHERFDAQHGVEHPTEAMNEATAHALAEFMMADAQMRGL